jgi:phosphatidylserine synthase
MAAAVIVSLVVLAHHAGGERYIAAQGSLAVLVLSLAFLMVSTVHFRSFKRVRWKSRRTFTIVTLLGLSSIAVWVKLQGAYVFVFLLAVYIGLGIAETLLLRHRPEDAVRQDL